MELNNVKHINEDLRKQLDELKYTYDELKDERDQIFTSLKELKQSSQNSNDTMRYKHQIKLSEKKILDLEEKLKHVKINSNRLSSDQLIQSFNQSGRTSSVNSCLEPTEIDYLKKIIFSYMMGTDSVTMAKVIIAILKFNEDEKMMLIENEKNKNSWKFPVLQ